VDTEQIRSEMRLTRASIDRKLDALSDRTADAKQDAARRTAAGLVMTGIALIGVWVWRARRSRHVPMRDVLIS
jgi:hypothetical protein